jgi:ATP-dependent helicase YprA (DUF1998 family)
VLVTYLKDDVREPCPGIRADVIRGYRGGYLPLQAGARSKSGLREGSVKGVVSTNALELGIDIGALDVSVMAGVPRHDRRHVAAGRPRSAAAGDVRPRCWWLSSTPRSISSS